MDIIESLEWRYAVKKFDETKQLTDDQLNTLKKAFNLTATSYGLQTISLVVVRNQELQKQLQEHSFNQGQLSQASDIFVICMPKTFKETHIDEYFERIKLIRETPDDVLNSFKGYLKRDVEKKSEEQIENWNKNQAYIALGNLMTTCAVEKIDSCPMEGFIPSKYDELLGLEKYNLTSVLVLPVGFRASDDYMKELKKVRKGVENCVIEIS